MGSKGDVESDFLRLSLRRYQTVHAGLVEVFRMGYFNRVIQIFDIVFNTASLRATKPVVQRCVR